MDPLESMSTGGPLPKNFDAENAANMEDVRLVCSPRKSLADLFVSRVTDGEAVRSQGYELDSLRINKHHIISSVDTRP